MKSQNTFQKMRIIVNGHGFTWSNIMMSSKPDISVSLCTLAGEWQPQSNNSLIKNCNDSAPVQNWLNTYIF